MPPPPALRRYLGFARLPARSLEAVARVVERDDAFRERVAGAVTEEQVGRAGWLWLERPAGWAEELAGLEAEWARRQAEQAEAREERAAGKKLAAAQAAAARAEADAAARRADLEAAREDLRRERAARGAAESRVAELEALVSRAEADRGDAVRELKRTEGRLVERATELNGARARIRELESAAATGDRPGPAGDAGRPVAPAGAPDGGVAAGEVARAAAAAGELAEALAALARGLAAGEDGDASGDDGGPGPPAGGRAMTGNGGPAAAAPAGTRPRRQPVPLPGGLFDDTVEAAEHLLRTPGAVLVVDGYNVTMAGWPDLAVADQRRRLLAAVCDLAARTATRVEVVFDGAEVDAGPVPAPGRQLVRVRFTEPGIEADDVVIELVGRIPAATPVIVASSDGRVRDGCRRLGANLLHARQLVAALRA